MYKKLAYFALILMFFGVSLAGQAAQAAVEDTRYFVKSTSPFWKKSFGVRHNFDDGFTTDATEWQLRLAKMFGVEVEPVKKLHVLPAATSKSPIVRHKPSDQIPWGIEVVYNNPLLDKTLGGAGVSVAVLDTGVYKAHPDLKNRIAECKDFTSAKLPFADGKCDDKNGHGTHVAGIIAANAGADGLGVYGVAPESKLFAYKVCMNNGSCWADDIAVALRTAANNGTNIVNLSLGSDGESKLITDAVVYATGKGTLVIAAAGNDGPYQGSIDYPAYNAEVVGVGAVDPNVIITEWSSRGSNSKTQAYVRENGDIEFAAPGANIESTWNDGGYVILSGTSMAAPHVSGLAAKLWQKDALSPALETRNLLRQFSKDLAPLGDDDDSGWGLPTL